MIKIIVNRHAGSRRIERKNKKNTKIVPNTFPLRKPRNNPINHFFHMLWITKNMISTLDD